MFQFGIFQERDQGLLLGVVLVVVAGVLLTGYIAVGRMMLTPRTTKVQEEACRLAESVAAYGRQHGGTLPQLGTTAWPSAATGPLGPTGLPLLNPPLTSTIDPPNTQVVKPGHISVSSSPQSATITWGYRNMARAERRNEGFSLRRRRNRGIWLPTRKQVSVTVTPNGGLPRYEKYSCAPGALNR